MDPMIDLTGKRLTGEQWRQATVLRDEWAAAVLSTTPADRPAAEAAVAELYRAGGWDPPRMVWSESPAAASFALWQMARRGQLGRPLRDRMVWEVRSDLKRRLRATTSKCLGVQDFDWMTDQQDPVTGSTWSQFWAGLVAELAAAVDGLVTWLPTGQMGVLREQAQMWSQVRHIVEPGLRTQLDDPHCQLWGQVHNAFTQYGFDAFGPRGADLSWPAEAAALERLGVASFSPHDRHELDLWGTLATGAGWWWPCERVCVLSERPAQLGRDAAGRLHHGSGPAIVYRDGLALYFWHGTPVPADVIERDWTLPQILAEDDVEVRRCVIERRGWDTFFSESGLYPVASAPDPGNAPHHLVLYALPRELAELYEEPADILLCVNGTPEPDGTHRRYGLPVPAGHHDPVAAAAQLYGLPVETYRRLEVRR